MGPEVMMIATIASGAMSAMSTMRAGDAKQSEYEVKAAQARANAQREAANAMIEGNNVMRKLQATNSTAVARGFAGGVDGFSGSAKLMQQISNKQAGKDLRMTDLAAKESKSFGEVQSMMFLEAGAFAKRSSRFDAFTKLASTAVSAGSLKTGGTKGGGGGSSSYGMPGSGTPSYGSTAYWKGSA